MNYFVYPGVSDPLQARIEDIIDDCAALYHLPPHKVRYRERRTITGRQNGVKNTHVYARQLAMAIIRAKYKKSLKGVGLVFGGYDHSTVIYSIRQVSDQIEMSPDYQELVEPILKKYGIKFIDILKL